MKKTILLLATLFYLLAAHSQNVGIGTSSPGALLDVSATNNGILIPRVALTGTGSYSPLTSPAVSTMVYNTATATNVTPGYYYWSGTAWIRLIDNTSIGGATTVSNTSSANTLSTTVNGVTGSTVPMVNSLSNTSSANTLSTTVNGVTGATVPMVNSISNTSSVNTLSTTVNGVTGTTVSIINSNTLGLSGNTLTSTVNGVAPTQSLSGLSLTGDVTGTLAGSTVVQIQGKPVSATAPTAGQVLEYIGSTWTPTSPTLGTVTSIATTGPVTGGAITGTGTIGCTTCATTTNGGALSGTSPVAVSAAGAISCATCLTTGTVSGLANPSTLIGMSVTNGSGTTAMYANAAPAINPAIVPTWTGTHTFSNATYSALFTGGYVGIGTSSPAAALDITSTTSGFLPPRLASNPVTPVTGMIYYNTATNCLMIYAGTWQNIYCSGQTQICSLPITLTNSQATATPTGFQQMITAVSSNYTAYENAGLQNVEFTTGAGATGTILQAWIESGASNASGSTIYWVNLGGSTINGSGGTLTIYMNFIGGTNVSSVMSSAGPTGEAPQLSTVYGQYDNGGLVFNTLYNNFAGSSISGSFNQSLPAGSTITQNNGVTIASSASSTYGGLICTAGFASSPAQIFDGDVTAVSGVAGGLALQNGNLGTSGSIDFNFWGGSVATGTMNPPGMVNADNPNLQLSTGIMGGVWLASTTQLWYKNYAATAGTQNAYTLPATIYPSIGVYCCSPSTSITFQWIRARYYPPNNVMPGVTIGSMSCL